MLEDDPLEEKPCTHAGAYAALAERVRLVAAADTDGDRLEAFSERYGVKDIYEDYGEMLREVKPDIVSVCAYAPERHAMVMDAIGAGVKGVWCEKAFATSLGEAREMARAARESGAAVVVSHLRRWSGEYERAKEIIDSGEIGRVTSITAHFSGSLIHTGTHAFDVLLWFAGEAEWVEGTLEETDGGDLPWDIAEDPGGRAIIKFKNGAYASVHGEARDYFNFEFEVTGTRGRVRIGNNRLLELHTPEADVNYTGISELVRSPFPPVERKNIWTGALANLMGAMEGSEENMNGPEDGEKALELALAIHMSSRDGGRRVSLPLDEKSEKFTIRSR